MTSTSNYAIPSSYLLTSDGGMLSPVLVLHDKKTVAKIAAASSLAILAQVAAAYMIHKNEYADIISVREYQSIEDVVHNRTTIATNRCLIRSAENYLDNWNRFCSYYGLAEGCGLPKEKYDLLYEGLNKDNAMCRDANQYAIPSRVGPSTDKAGHLLQ